MRGSGAARMDFLLQTTFSHCPSLLQMRLVANCGHPELSMRFLHITLLIFIKVLKFIIGQVLELFSM